ncbi:uncharacterized protein DFL_000153 [Arthrobotrys flagrans]|uniref:Uncharacterized protein n=1 Tax=Arthrobotrys flagrans TaxID=97331 RepID=A0A437ACZ2_ARTFL|nr:hypothetical protein DFL_000153 [Arthrobotrys flagrans]
MDFFGVESETHRNEKPERPPRVSRSITTITSASAPAQPHPLITPILPINHHRPPLESSAKLLCSFRSYPAGIAKMAKDPRVVDDEDHDEQGASPKELLFAACRSNNTDLLTEVLSQFSQEPPADPSAEPSGSKEDEGSTETPLSKFLNESRDSLGRMALHVAAKYGNPEILDMLLDQEGLEVDPESLMEGDTPLHVAAQHTSEDSEVGGYLIHLLVDAGADPRIKNKGLQKPLDLVDPGCAEIRTYLQEAEAEIEQEARQEAAQRAFDADIARQTKHGGDIIIDDLDEAGSGPASDSE